MRIVLLGPQRTPAVRGVLRSMELDGPIASITAGWQEREPDDAELDDQLDGRSVNLSLYARWLDVTERDPEFAAALRQLRQLLDDVQELYVLRVGYALRAAYDLQRRGVTGRVRAETPLEAGLPADTPMLVEAGMLAEAVDAVRAVDGAHLRRINAIYDEFFDHWRPHERTIVAGHRAAVSRIIADSAALVVTGGHVGALVRAMHLFTVGASLELPVIAWSAGAMALTDRIVLFHDRAVEGRSDAEVYLPGIGLLHDVVALPHAQRRLRLDDPGRMSIFARRFAPAHCVVLEPGSRVDTDSSGFCPVGTRLLADDGRVAVLASA